MNGISHERPGVYSVYDTSAVVSAGQAPKAVGVAARAAKGTVGTAVTVTGYAAGAEAFEIGRASCRERVCQYV